MRFSVEGRCLVPNGELAGGYRCATHPWRWGEEISQVLHRLWLGVSAAQLHDRPLGAGFSVLALGKYREGVYVSTDEQNNRNT